MPGTGENEEEVNNYLICTEFQLYKMKIVLKMDSGNGNTSSWIYLLPVKFTFKNGYAGKLYVMCILL